MHKTFMSMFISFHYMLNILTRYSLLQFTNTEPAFYLENTQGINMQDTEHLGMFHHYLLIVLSFWEELNCKTSSVLSLKRFNKLLLLELGIRCSSRLLIT